ncbi:MAG: DUF1178 family protein [Spirochaetes bacterium]|nr:MAG: DUF1178 family protein [Spirochaetota bacterium]
MISFDLECESGHRFEGSFRDYEAYAGQLERKLVRCPLCDSPDVKRLFTGCSVQARPAGPLKPADPSQNIFAMLRRMERFVKENFDHVGRDFAETARAIHYGQEPERGIYGESTVQEMKELHEEGIGVLPLPDVNKIEN